MAVKRLIPRRMLAAAAVVAAAVLAAFATVTPGSGAERIQAHWLGAWAASPLAGSNDLAGFGLVLPSVDNQTVRSIVFLHFGGRQVRVRLTNTFGAEPLTIDAADVALPGSGAATVPGSDHRLTFGGRASVTIPVGAEAISDPVAMDVRAEQRLSISTYVPGKPTKLTWHADARQTNFISVAGNHASEVGASSFVQTITSWLFLDGVDVAATKPDNAVVALGDSITDGAQSTVNANNRWPDFLARRLLARQGNHTSVLNEGIGGGRLLNDSECFGVNGLARLDRDVLDQDGVHFLIEFLGFNDLGFPVVNFPPPAGNCFIPKTAVSANDIIAGKMQVIAQAHLKGLRVYGATITPSSIFPPATNAEREAVNHWIRISGAFDAVIDFDAVVRDPSNPARLNPIFDSGDHVHPNDAGYQAMGSAIPLSLFRPSGEDSQD